MFKMRLLYIVCLHLSVCFIANAEIIKDPALIKSFCEGKNNAFDGVTGLSINDSKNLTSYLFSLQSDKIIDEIVVAYSAVDPKQLSDPVKVILASANIRKYPDTLLDIISLLNFQSNDDIIEGYRIALLQSMQVKVAGKSAGESFAFTLDKVKTFDPSIYSQLIDADIVADTKHSEKYISQVVKLNDDDPYKSFLLTKLEILRLGRDRNIWTSDDKQRVINGFKKAYDSCPFNQEFAIIYAQQLLNEKNFKAVKDITERTIGSHKYVSPYLHLYRLFAAHELKEKDIVDKEVDEVNNRLSWYSPYEFHQIQYIKKNKIHGPVPIFKMIAIGCVTLLLLYFGFKVLRRR